MSMFIENFRLALFSIKANKMRALLTMLGIIIGISSVIAIMTVGDSLAASLSSSLSELGADNLYIQVTYREDGGGEDDDLWAMSDEEVREWVRTHYPKEEDYITLDMVERYADYMGDRVRAISVISQMGSAKAVDGSLYANVSILGESLGALMCNNVQLVEGRYFTPQETENASKVCIVSDKLIENMFDGDKSTALGKQINIELGDKNFDYTIVGIYEHKQNALISMMDFGSSGKNVRTNMYVPLRTALNYTHEETFEYIDVMMGKNETEESFIAYSNRFWSREYEKNENFIAKTESNTAQLSSIMGLVNTLTIGVSVIAGIALLVGGIGVMNIMLVSITERTREIGTRKALGAPNSSIRMQFIIEAIVLCLIGGLIGILLGCAGGLAAAKLIGGNVTPSIRAILISLTFSMAIGVFFGYYPANKAAKMDPIDALRYE